MAKTKMTTADLTKKDDILDFDLGDAEDLQPLDEEKEKLKETDKEPEDPIIKDEKKDKKEKEDASVALTEQEIEDAIKADSESDDPSKDKGTVTEDEIVAPLFDAMVEKFEWDTVKDEDKPKTLEEFFEVIEDIISTNSKPEYHDPLVEQFDTYMKAGGDPAKFIEVNYTSPDYENMDIEQEAIQKRIVRDYYNLTGMKESKIDKLIKSLEEDNTLLDEAKELQPELAEVDKYKKNEVAKEAQTREQTKRDNIDRQIKTMGSQVMKMDDVYGVPITKKDKEDLLPYMYLVGKDGKTQLQREINENPAEYYVATTMLFKNRKALKDSIKQTTNKKAIDTLREKQKELANKSRKTSDRSPEDEGGDDWLTSWYNQFNKKKNV